MFVFLYEDILKIDNLWSLVNLTKLQMDNNIIERIEGLDMLVNLEWLGMKSLITYSNEIIMNWNGKEMLRGLFKTFILYKYENNEISQMNTINSHVHEKHCVVLNKLKLCKN